MIPTSYNNVKAGQFTFSIKSVLSRLHHTEGIEELVDCSACTVNELNWLPDPSGQPHTATIVLDDDEHGLVGNYLALILQDQSSLDITFNIIDDDDMVKAIYRLESPVITQLTSSPRNRYTEDYDKECQFTLTVKYAFAKRSN